MNALGSRTLAACGAIVVAIACGDVPTSAGGIAYISPIVLPSQAVAAGDTLRDSLGRVAPLRVYAIGTANDTISATPRFLVTSLPAGVTISASGIVVALDSPRTVQIVGRIGDRLQTTTAALEVVSQPDSIAKSGTVDSLRVATPSSALQVTVTGRRRTTRVPVKGIIVRYAITNIYPSRPVNPTEVFFPDGLRGNLTLAVDTTDASGVASRSITASALTGIDSITVQVAATSLRATPLGGSPVRFTLPVKKGT